MAGKPVVQCSGMSGFDEPGVFYSEAFFSDDRSEDGDISRVAAQRRFKEFIKTFLDHDNVYCYRSAPVPIGCGVTLGYSML